MDLELQYNFSPAQQKQINTCRIYLQVVLLSDIIAADGRYILSQVIQGYQPQYRNSSLHWPQYPRPKNWSTWHLLLQHLGTGRFLNTPLGRWTNSSRQTWEWFYYVPTNALYHKSHYPVPPSTFHTLVH
jgi:hypothetical protein